MQFIPVTAKQNFKPSSASHDPSNRPKEQNLFEIEISTIVFTVTFSQFNVSLLKNYELLFEW